MKKTMAAMLLLLATSVAVLGGSGTANAYPEASIRVEFSDQVVRGGSQLTVHATANVECVWTATFADQRRTGAGKEFTATFRAPRVEKKTTFPLTVTCRYGEASAATLVSGGGGRFVGTSMVRAATSSVSRTYSVTVLPARNQGGAGPGATSGGAGLLPGTGGPEAGLLIGGLGLLLAGAVALVVARRRARGH